jgi:signal peptidase II
VSRAARTGAAGRDEGSSVSRKWIVFAVTASTLVTVDAWSKLWALAALEHGITRLAWGGFLKLTLSFNRGAAFGLDLGSGSRFIFIALSLVVLGWLLSVYRRNPGNGRLRAAGVILVSAGAGGNLLDRIFRGRGVVDFLGPYDLGFMVWPIFNLADCYVVIGIGLLVLSMRHGRLTPVPGQSASGQAHELDAP